MIPGMRNFFGAKMGRSVLGAIGALSPLRIQHVAGDRISATIERTAAVNARAWRGMDPRPGLSDLARSYFKGYTVPEMVSGGDPATLRFRQRMRFGALAAIGAKVGSDFFLGEGNPISNTLSFGMRGAMHVGLAGAIGMRNPLLGSIYMGATAINALRGGDNLGPF